MDHPLDDHELAHLLAAGAGERLVELRTSMVAAGATSSELKAAGDASANDWILSELRRARPEDPILSEEERDDPEAVQRRLRSSRAWIIDPLDGTREFSEPDRTDWAVHIALAVDGVATVGAVCLPALGETLSTFSVKSAAGGAARHAATPPRVVLSRTRRPAPAVAISERLGTTIIEMGSAGAKAMAVVRDEADIYPHSGGQYEWDSCAPVAVAIAAGLWCSRLDGLAASVQLRGPVSAGPADLHP